ncbi:MAG: ExeA family protein [Acidobacteriota bacterium]|nr:AAA family ATPase [Thermoanaerobaculaceae bacterium]
MFREFYNLKERPFGKTPDPKFLYLSKEHEEALARLEYAIEERDMAVLTGEIGSGKTTISRALMDRNEKDHFILIVNPRLSPNQLLREIARRLDLEPKYFRSDLLEEISSRFMELNEEGRAAILIVDEAQLIPGKQTFDELRLLSNFQLDDANLISIILIGQPELKERLKHPSYAALRQRIGMWYHLKSLNEKETVNYIKHRIKIAGGDPSIFTLEAMKMIFEKTRGVPRLINSVATNALLSGFEKEEKPITVETVKEASAEIMF